MIQFLVGLEWGEMIVALQCYRIGLRAMLS